MIWSLCEFIIHGIAFSSARLDIHSALYLFAHHDVTGRLYHLEWVNHDTNYDSASTTIWFIAIHRYGFNANTRIATYPEISYTCTKFWFFMGAASLDKHEMVNTYIIHTYIICTAHPNLGRLAVVLHVLRRAARFVYIHLSVHSRLKHFLRNWFLQLSKSLHFSFSKTSAHIPLKLYDIPIHTFRWSQKSSVRIA